jgi:hypothetical protein
VTPAPANPNQLGKAIADAAAIAWAKQAQAALRDPARIQFPRWPR